MLQGLLGRSLARMSGRRKSNSSVRLDTFCILKNWINDAKAVKTARRGIKDELRLVKLAAWQRFAFPASPGRRSQVLGRCSRPASCT